MEAVKSCRGRRGYWSPESESHKSDNQREGNLVPPSRDNTPYRVGAHETIHAVVKGDDKPHNSLDKETGEAYGVESSGVGCHSIARRDLSRETQCSRSPSPAPLVLKRLYPGNRLSSARL